jgi:glycerate-2-kinase
MAWGTLAALAGLAVLAAALEAEAQDPAKFLAQTRETARQGWGLLNTIGSVVIGGGALVSLAAGMYQGRWGQAAISFVAGAAGLLALWGIGAVLGF